MSLSITLDYLLKIDRKDEPYNFLKNGASIEEIDHVIEEAAYIEIFHRIPGLNTDSITSIIKKK